MGCGRREQGRGSWEGARAAGCTLNEALYYAVYVKARVVGLLDQPLRILSLVADRRLIRVRLVLLGFLPLFHLQRHRLRIGEAADLAQDDVSRPPRLRVCGGAGKHGTGRVEGEPVGGGGRRENCKLGAAPARRGGAAAATATATGAAAAVVARDIKVADKSAERAVVEGGGAVGGGAADLISTSADTWASAMVAAAAAACGVALAAAIGATLLRVVLRRLRL